MVRWRDHSASDILNGNGWLDPKSIALSNLEKASPPVITAVFFMKSRRFNL